MIYEFRIPLPVTVEEYKVAQLYMVAQASRDNTGGGEGVEVLKNEPYDNTDGHLTRAEFSNVEIPRNKGQYTLKKYYVASRVPSFVAALLPSDSLVLVEESWNAYPHCLTVVTNGYLDHNKFCIVLETMHAPDRGAQENACGATSNELKQRKVELLDVARPVPQAQYVPEDDPAQIRSEKTGRGPFEPGFYESCEPVMTCYKLVRCNFKYWGLQSRTESAIVNQQRDLFIATHRNLLANIDNWHGKTIEDMRRLEDEVQEELLRLRESEEKRGALSTTASSDAGAATP